MTQKRILALLIVFSFMFTITNHPIKQADASSATTKPTLETAQRILQSQFGFFTENKGQWDPNILFVGDTSFGKVAFAKDAIYYQMIKVEETKKNEKNTFSPIDSYQNRFKNQERSYQTQTVKLSFVNPGTPMIEGTEVLSHYNNYFIGNDPKRWASNCRNFAKVTYQDIWTGIDLAYFFTPEGMKYEYYVEPEADIQTLQIKVDGAELKNHGSSLQIATKLGNIQDANLKVYDQTTGFNIQSSFSIQTDIFSFQGIPEKRENTIVIDPLVYSTYLGGSGDDFASGIAVDSSGNVYTSGSTNSTDFPTTLGAFQTSYKELDVFVSKFNTTNNTFLYSTYIGGSGGDASSDITLDSIGNVYFCGSTDSIDFPTTPGTNQTTNKGNWDVFVTKLNSTGSSLIYSTYLGGSGNEKSSSIVLDSAGNVYICGQTNSISLILGDYPFPTTLGAYQTECKDLEDGFVTKLNDTGTAILYSTYLGGTTRDDVTGIAVDDKGNAYVTGWTWSKDFPTTSGAFQTTFQEGISDVYVTKLNTTGTSLIYSTFIGEGGTWESHIYISLDVLDNACITGTTDSTDFPTTLGVYQDHLIGGNEVFVTKLNASGTDLIFSTYLGDYSGQKAAGIAMDNTGNVFITGYSDGPFPTTPGAFQTRYKMADAFITKFDTTCSTLLYSSLLGGTGEDDSRGIGLDSAGNVYIYGHTTSTDFPTTSGAYQIKSKGKYDAFITKFSFDSNPDPNPPPPPSQTGTVSFSSTPSGASISISGTNRGITPLTLTFSPGSYTATFSLTGYEEESKSFTITAGKDISVYAELKKKTTQPPPAPSNQSVVIRLTLGSNIAAITRNGKFDFVTLDLPPFTQDGRTMVPLRFIAESFGAKLQWTEDSNNSGEGQILIALTKSDGSRINIQMHTLQKIAIIERYAPNSTYPETTRYEMEVAPFIVRPANRTVVPIRFIAEGFGSTVNWYPETKEIEIQYSP